MIFSKWKASFKTHSVADNTTSRLTKVVPLFVLSLAVECVDITFACCLGIACVLQFRPMT